jgi:Tol biopolymer transport system component
MQIFRMKRDGSEQTQMTFEDRNNWFAHVSPDGQKVVNLSYSKEGLDAKEHLPNMDVELWMMSPDGSNREKILEFFGGQGSINVNSWSPDSRKFAFVMYELEHK